MPSSGICRTSLAVGLAAATVGSVALAAPASASIAADSHISCVTYDWWESMVFFDGVAGRCTTITSTGPNLVEEFDWNGNYWTVS